MPNYFFNKNMPTANTQQNNSYARCPGAVLQHSSAAKHAQSHLQLAHLNNCLLDKHIPQHEARTATNTPGPSKLTYPNLYHPLQQNRQP
jgi:hypothetical protein